MKNELTARQQQVVDFISDFISSQGFGPATRDFCEHFGWKSPNAVAQHLKLIEKKGFIRRTPNTARAIVVVDKNPQPVCTGF